MDEFNKKKALEVFRREKKSAFTAAKEIYGLALSLDEESQKEARKILGTEVYLQCIKEISEFNENVVLRIEKVSLQKDCTELQFKQAKKAIWIAMDKAKNKFNWDNPILDFVPEEV